MKTEINKAGYYIIWLIIIANIIRSIIEFVFFSQDNDLLHIYNVAIHIICIYSLYLIIEKLKEEGFWIFVFINLINAFVLSTINNSYIEHFTSATLYICILYLILRLKKNSVSIWNSLK